MEIELKVCSGSKITELLIDLANLRIKVFREYPYLYDGSLAYEQKYLQTYTNHPEAIIVAALSDGVVVGASTAIPLLAESEEIQKPFLNNGYRMDEVFYFGESVLLKPYRGFGIGKRFMQHRLDFARSHQYKLAAFCAVDRPSTHKHKPADYRSLDKFWEKQGFRKQNHLKAHLSWKDIDKDEEDTKSLTFWMKDL